MGGEMGGERRCRNLSRLVPEDVESDYQEM